MTCHHSIRPYRLDKIHGGALRCRLICMSGTCLALIAALSLGFAQLTHGKSYWQAIAREKFELPAGEQAAPLADELIGNLGSPAPATRGDPPGSRPHSLV